jgi:hypothetical protein
MNRGLIVRKGFTLYLKVIGFPLDKPAYFEIQNFATKDKIKEIATLSEEFDIDLSGRKIMKIKINYKNAAKYDVIDIETGVRIPLVQEADDKKGEFIIILYDYANERWVADLNGELLKFKIKRPIKIIKKIKEE